MKHLVEILRGLDLPDETIDRMVQAHKEREWQKFIRVLMDTPDTREKSYERGT